MFARDTERTIVHAPPPWVTTSFPSPTSSESSLASASASNGDDGNDVSSTDTSSTTPQTSSFTGPTTFTTSVSLGNGAVDLSASSTGFGASQGYEDGSTAPTYWWSTAYGVSDTTLAPSSSLKPTPAALDSLSGSVPSFTDSSSSGSTSTDPAGVTNQHGPGHGARRPFNGSLLAGIIVPIVLLLLAGIGIVFFLRHRRRSRTEPLKSTTEIREKTIPSWSPSSEASVAAGQTRPPQPHLIMSPQNNTYFTGLDTMSMMSAEARDRTSEEPPPPYWPQNEATGRSVSMRSNGRSIVQPTPVFLDVARPLSSVDGQAIPEHSPFDDPPEGVVRTPSFNSITSTLYSSNASVVEARPARRSIVSAHMVGEENSPFADPDTEMDVQH